MRDRLIELLEIHFITKLGTRFHREVLENIADYLLTNGVIFPPCKVGDKIYRTMEYNGKLVNWDIVKMEVFPDEIGFVDDSDNYFSANDIGKTVFLTREEAEAKLKEGAE